MHNYYYLNGDHSVRPCSVEEWQKQSEQMRINKTKHINDELILDNRVSTVWLGRNHNFYEGKPELFETMIFNKNEHGIYCDRYDSWDDAVEGHKKAVQWVLDGCKENE